MSAAHTLFLRLGMPLEKGDHTRYPASEAGPNDRLRYWATELKDHIQFGIQLRSLQNFFADLETARLQTFGFEVRANGREWFVRLPTDIAEAEIRARAAIAVITELLTTK